MLMQNKNSYEKFLNYLTLCAKDNRSMIMGLEDIGAIWWFKHFNN